MHFSIIFHCTFQLKFTLVKSLADLHEGTLAVESEEGKGSKFTFSLQIGNTYPKALHKEDEPTCHQSISVPPSKNKESASAAENTEDVQADILPLLLIVEDNEDIRQYIVDSMGNDFRIIQAADGYEGTMLAMEQIPDIIVSDIMMPKMNGIELTHRIKEDIRTSHIPIILLTAKDKMEDKEDGYNSGADSYLTKPFSVSLLQSRIQNLLANRRHLAELIAFHNSSQKKTSHPTESSDPTLSRLDKEFLDKMNKVIEDNITTEDLNMNFMSDKMAMSYSTFYRKVKALTGMTAKEYINKCRLQYCVQMLENGDYNVTEAAMMTGFKDLDNFRIAFKKEYGVPPSKYAKKK